MVKGGCPFGFLTLLVPSKHEGMTLDMGSDFMMCVFLVESILSANEERAFGKWRELGASIFKATKLDPLSVCMEFVTYGYAFIPKVENAQVASILSNRCIEGIPEATMKKLTRDELKHVHHDQWCSTITCRVCYERLCNDCNPKALWRVDSPSQCWQKTAVLRA